MDAFRAGFVYVEDCYAGTLSETEDGYRFAYDADYLTQPANSLRHFFNADIIFPSFE